VDPAPSGGGGKTRMRDFRLDLWNRPSCSLKLPVGHEIRPQSVVAGQLNRLRARGGSLSYRAQTDFSRARTGSGRRDRVDLMFVLMVTA